MNCITLSARAKQYSLHAISATTRLEHVSLLPLLPTRKSRLSRCMHEKTVSPCGKGDFYLSSPWDFRESLGLRKVANLPNSWTSGITAQPLLTSFKNKFIDVSACCRKKWKQDNLQELLQNFLRAASRQAESSRPRGGSEGFLHAGSHRAWDPQGVHNSYPTRKFANLWLPILHFHLHSKHERFEYLFSWTGASSSGSCQDVLWALETWCAG